MPTWVTSASGPIRLAWLTARAGPALCLELLSAKAPCSSPRPEPDREPVLPAVSRLGSALPFLVLLATAATDHRQRRPTITGAYLGDPARPIQLRVSCRAATIRQHVRTRRAWPDLRAGHQTGCCMLAVQFLTGACSQFRSATALSAAYGASR